MAIARKCRRGGPSVPRGEPRAHKKPRVRRETLSARGAPAPWRGPSALRRGQASAHLCGGDAQSSELAAQVGLKRAALEGGDGGRRVERLGAMLLTALMGVAEVAAAVARDRRQT